MIVTSPATMACTHNCIPPIHVTRFSASSTLLFYHYLAQYAPGMSPLCVCVCVATMCVEMFSTQPVQHTCACDTYNMHLIRDIVMGRADSSAGEDGAITHT